jgi:hypothetical protein
MQLTLSDRLDNVGSLPEEHRDVRPDLPRPCEQLLGSCRSPCQLIGGPQGGGGIATTPSQACAMGDLWWTSTQGSMGQCCAQVQFVTCGSEQSQGNLWYLGTHGAALHSGAGGG